MGNHRRAGRLAVASALLIGTMVVAIAAPPATPASALTTVVVNSTLDEPWNGTPNTCISTPGGACTLRAALEMLKAKWNLAEFDDVIVDLTTLPAGSIIETSGTLDVPNMLGRTVELRGSLVPSRRVVIQAVGAAHRVMVFNGTPSDTLIVNGLALRGGSADQGGALRASGGVVLRNVEASGNTATDAGGAFHVSDWNLTIEDSAIFGNVSQGDGGGLFGAATTLSMTRTAVFDNTASGDGGGVLINPRASSSPTFRQSAFRGNLAAGNGSAIACGSCSSGVHNLNLLDSSVVTSRGPSPAVWTDGELFGTNLTVADNAGIGLRAAGGPLTHATITRNTGTALVALGSAWNGGQGFSATSSALDGSCTGPAVLVSGSVLKSAACPTSGGTASTGPYTVGMLAEIGGVRTGDGRELPVAQLTDHLDGAPCASPTDARGLTRESTNCEFGAVESNVGGPNLTLEVTSAADSQDAITGDGVCADAYGECTLRAAVMEAEAFPSQDEILLGNFSIALAAPPTSGVYTCDLGADSARCGDLDTTFLTVSGRNLPAISVSAPYRVFEARGNLTLSNFNVANSGGPDESTGGVLLANIATGQTVTLQDVGVASGHAQRGGGLYATGTGNLVLDDVAFWSNRATLGGGGMYVASGLSVDASRVRFDGNTAGSGGGGLRIDAGTSLRLTNSYVFDNTAGSGGGLSCTCTDVELRQVTFAGNTASFGGGIATGDATSPPTDALRLVNVSVVDNHSSQGGAVEVSGEGLVGREAVPMRMTHTTIAGNDSGGPTAGLVVSELAGGGTVTLVASVISGNSSDVSETAIDCTGQVATDGASFATSSACVVTSGPALAPAGELQPMVDVDMPYAGISWNDLELVPVVEPASGSPVIDSVVCDPAIPVDVVGAPRKVGAACDAGAVEATGIAMRLFASSAAPTAAGSVVPLAKLPPSAVKSTVLPGGGQAPTVDNQAIRSIDLQGSPLGRIALGDLPLGRIALAGSPLGRIALSSIPVSIDGGWEGLLENTQLNGIPLQNVTFAEVLALDPPVADDLQLGQLDLSATPLGRIPLGSIAFATVPLSELSLPAGYTWCGVIEESVPGTECGPGTTLDPARPDTTLMSVSLAGVPLGRIPLGRIPLGRIDLTDTPLGRIALAEIDLAASPLGRIPLGRIDLTDTPLGRISVRDVPLGRIPLGRIPLGRIDLATSPLGRIPLGRIDLATSPLGRIPLGRIPLARIATVVDCTRIDCATATIAQAAAAQALVPGATLAQLGEYGDATLADLVGLFDGGPGDADDLVLQDLGEYGDATLADFEALIATLAGFDGVTLSTLGAGELGDLTGWETFDEMLATMTIAELIALLPADVVEQLTLGALLQGVVDPGDYPWEDLDLAAAADDLAGTGGVVTFVAEITSNLQDPTDYAVDIDLPAGFRYVADSLTYDGLIRSTTVAPGRAGVDAVLEPRTGTTQVTLQAIVPLAIGAAGAAAASLTTSTPDDGTITIEASGVDQVVSEAFEVNDTADVATPIEPDTLYLTHVGTATDVDWFSIDLDQGDRMSVILSNLDEDLDVVLFGQAPDPLRGTPEGSVLPASDGGRSLLAQGTVPAVVPLDDLDTTPPPGGTVIAVSTNRGTTDERIETTPLEAGRYWIRVTGYQGASSAQPYALRATVTRARFSGQCPAITRTAPSVLPANRTDLPEGATTLFVVDSVRLATVYPASDAEGVVDGPDVLDALDALTEAVNAPAPVGGDDPFGTETAAVLDVSSLVGVQRADRDWDADPCSPAAANGAVTAIGAAIDATRASLPTIAHVVIVGNDDQIPFARLRDATVYSNEREYAAELGDSQSPLTAALSLGYLLSDDPYADEHPLSVGPRELFVPTVAIGRLVEKPAEIKTAIDNYVRFEGELDPSTALSTGYDFLSDGADAVAQALEANGLPTDDRLINDHWTTEQLNTAIGDGADVISLNAHFDHYRALPADQNARGVQDDLFTIDNMSDATRAALEGTVLFSMGCHAGLSVSDVTVSGLRQGDWAQTLTGAGAVFAGNTGYGYGDDAVVGATEDLMHRFAIGLDGTITIGQAMAQAKQQYIAATAVLTPFDEKVVSQVVMYGMPQLRIGDGTPEQPPANPPVAVDPATGLDAAGVALTGTVGQAGSEFQAVTTDRGSYYTYRGDTLTTAGQPIQPRAVVDLTQPGHELRGVLLTGLTSTDTPAPDPVYFTPTVDLGATSAEIPAAPNTFPTALQSVSSYGSVTGRRDQAVLVPGQFIWNPGTTGGTQRLFTSIAGTAFYAPTSGSAAADVVAPTILRSTAVLDAGSLSLRVEVADESAIRLVTVLYTDAANPGAWTEVRLAPLGNGVFGKDLPAVGFTSIDFFTQAVDAGGNVARSSNKGTYFASVTAAAPRIAVSGPLDPSGWYTGPVEVMVTPVVAGDAVSVQLNGTEINLDGAPIQLSSDAVWDVTASTRNSPSERAIVRIDSAAPTISGTRNPAAPRVVGPVDVTLLAADDGIGVASLTYTTTGAQASGPTTVAAATTSVRIAAVGDTTLTARAVDVLGHESAPFEVRVTVDPIPDVDVDPPVAACGASPTGWKAANVTVSCQVSDAGVGLADPAQGTIQLSTSVGVGAAATDAMTNTADVCDRNNNCVTVGPFGPFSIDRAAPTVDVRYPLPNGTVYLKDNVLGDVGCGDVGSGVVSCSIGAIDTSTLGTKTVTATARDAVGNTATSTVTYQVTYLWGGFYLPFREPPQVNAGIRGMTYPVLFNVLDGRGRRITTRSAITAIESVPRTSCTSSTFGAPVAQNVSGLTDALLFWLYPWKTPTKAGCYQLRVHLDDGTVHVADFRLL